MAQPIGKGGDVVAGLAVKLQALPVLSKAAETPDRVPDMVMEAPEILLLLDEWGVLLEKQIEQVHQAQKWADGLWSVTAVPSEDYVVGL